MVDNVMPITQDTPKPRAAARLCNFKTGQATLLQDHKEWIDSEVGPALANMRGAWVDLIGYASKLGDPIANQKLSARRIEAVRAHIAKWKQGINFQKAEALGESRSHGAEDDNSGYFRSVEVFLYAFAPPPIKPQPEPEPEVTGKSFSIRVVSSLSAAVGPLGVDAVAFDIGEPRKRRWKRFWYTGPSLNVAIKLPKVPQPPVGIGGSGKSVNFTTNVPCELEDFEGEATLFNGPGVALGPISIGGDMGLAMESARLRAKLAFVKPRVIVMQNDTGLNLSFGGAGKGKLTLINL